MENYQSLNPSDSSIYIDYKNKENPVRFKYHKKKSPFKICYESFKGFWMKINLGLILIGGVLFIFLREGKKVIEDVSDLKDMTISEVGSDLIIVLFVMAGIASYFYIPPFLTAHVFSSNKKLLLKMPKINKFISLFPFNKSYYVKVTKLKYNKYEITDDFENTFLNYKATKDFSKFLSKVEITPYTYNYKIINIFRKKYKKLKEEYWKASFYFDKIPKKGKLEVWYA